MKIELVAGLQQGVLFAGEPHGLPLQHTLLPTYIAPLGYSSHAVGKWHLGGHQALYTPTHRGFLSHTGYWQGKQDYFDHTDFWTEVPQFLYRQ